ncbi:hypothetical protein DNTS_006024, partial [Danionella cerebrum]
MLKERHLGPITKKIVDPEMKMSSQTAIPATDISRPSSPVPFCVFLAGALVVPDS